MTDDERTRWNSTIRVKPNAKPLSRGKPPQRKARIETRTPVKKVNRKRGGHRFPKHVLEHFRGWVAQQPCLVTGLRTGAWITHPTLGRIRIHVDPAHVRSRGAGHPDARNIVPLARHLHEELDHQLRTARFNAKYGVDLEARAADTWQAYLRAQGLPLDDPTLAVELARRLKRSRTEEPW